MTTVLYADVLFLINFSMDFISVYLSSKLLSEAQNTLRFTLASVIGAACATLMTAQSPPVMAQIPLTLILSAVMSAVAYGKNNSISSCLVRTAALWGSGALIGGLVTAVCSLGENSNMTASLHPPVQSGKYIFILVLSVLFCVFLIRAIKPKFAESKVKLRIVLLGRSTEITALVDSGNLASDPIGKNPVIFVSHEVVEEIMGKENTDSILQGKYEGVSEDLKKRIRLVPISSEGGRKIVSCIRPDSVEICKGTKHHKVEALVGITENGQNFYGGEGALAPLCAVK